jgi:hypothetical protein
MRTDNNIHVLFHIKTKAVFIGLASRLRARSMVRSSEVVVVAGLWEGRCRTVTKSLL